MSTRIAVIHYSCTRYMGWTAAATNRVVRSLWRQYRSIGPELLL